MFHENCLYKIKTIIYVYTSEDFERVECVGGFWLAKGSLISIVAMYRHFYIIHTFSGVFRTKPFYSFSDYEESFERLA